MNKKHSLCSRLQGSIPSQGHCGFITAISSNNLSLPERPPATAVRFTISHSACNRNRLEFLGPPSLLPTSRSPSQLNVSTKFPAGATSTSSLRNPSQQHGGRLSPPQPWGCTSPRPVPRAALRPGLGPHPVVPPPPPPCFRGSSQALVFPGNPV